MRELAGGLPGQVLDDVLLCVTELVTNGVEHGTPSASDPILMTVSTDDDRIRVEVGDRGAGFRSHRFVHSTGERGRGLYIVHLLADRWGIDRRGITWVWFEIDLPRAGARR
jgi:serine/threonine-protein kinase RsbW